jgi:L-lactate dehydrogenase complex protein LldG
VTTGSSRKNPTALFTKNALQVNAVVHSVKNRTGAMDKTMGLLTRKSPLDPQMVSGKEAVPGTRTLAAPNLDPDLFRNLSEKCRPFPDIQLIRDRLRCFPGGIDMGMTWADYGIADTGTLVIASDSEDNRLATMLCEVHVAILNVSDIRVSADDMVEELSAMTARTGSYTAFITGASRTADIERVLAIGVHGPLELHIILVEEE